ncbi:MAG: hypothetical protein K8T20_05600 [Planctomycetes bacterium]|nr:hypothetical protein [Planctomycetota bacterium]
MIHRFIPLLALLLAAGCSAPPPPPPAAVADPRLLVKVLYVLEDGSVYRYDELATAAEKRNFREVRTTCDETFTRYSFTLHPEDAGHWWTSL